jgi:hypothetical protein
VGSNDVGEEDEVEEDADDFEEETSGLSPGWARTTMVRPAVSSTLVVTM